jgi:hypothetical protein
VAARDCSIVITSFERFAFLDLQLTFLRQQGFEGQLIIAEGGSLAYRPPQGFHADFDIDILHVPRLRGESAPQNAGRAMELALKAVTRPFFTLTCDDDLRIVKFLESAITAIRKFGGAYSVSGDRLYLDLTGPFARLPKIEFIQRLAGLTLRAPKIQRVYSLESEDALKRLNQFLQRPFHSMFAVTPTRFLPPARRLSTDSTPHLISDFNWLFNPILQGRIKRLAGFGTVSLLHGSNLSSSLNNPFKAQQSERSDLDPYVEFVRQWDGLAADVEVQGAEVVRDFDLGLLGRSVKDSRLGNLLLSGPAVLRSYLPSYFLIREINHAQTLSMIGRTNV